MVSLDCGPYPSLLLLHVQSCRSRILPSTQQTTIPMFQVVFSKLAKVWRKVVSFKNKRKRQVSDVLGFCGRTPTYTAIFYACAAFNFSSVLVQPVDLILSEMGDDVYRLLHSIYLHETSDIERKYWIRMMLLNTLSDRQILHKTQAPQ